MTDRVFLDANVLFSAAWLERSVLDRLWRLPDTKLITSRYAIAEAERNLDTEAQRARLQALVARLLLHDAASGGALPAGVVLVDKDAPILIAAIEARATHLLTGDRQHFGVLFGKSVGGVRVLLPAAYLRHR